jgi:methylated-DNA-protein-cysteine methyltransferase-like protein
MLESTLRIINTIRAIPEGKVASYRDIAITAGLPNGARQVVRVLHSMAESRKLPWYRVIKADGRIALPQGDGKELQIALLRQEGVEVPDTGQVDMAQYAVFVSKLG